MQANPTPTAAPAVAGLPAALAALPGAQRFDAAQRSVLHRLAYAALAGGDFVRARRFYEALAFYGGADGRAWRGAAAAAHALEDYRGAKLYWTLVSLLEDGPADATFYAARCQAQLGELAEACEGFEMVARDPRADAALRGQAAQLLALLTRRAA